MANLAATIFDNSVLLTLSPEQTTLKISGSDKQLVGSVASKIKTYRKIEPYKGKGVRIVGEYVRRKEGKKSA